jgi:catechol-2,3-dioxygenase
MCSTMGNEKRSDSLTRIQEILVRKIRTIMLFVKDIERTSAFYQRYFGLKPLKSKASASQMQKTRMGTRSRFLAEAPNEEAND